MATSSQCYYYFVINLHQNDAPTSFGELTQEVVNLSIPTTFSPCPKCNTLNSPQMGACTMCGARLPWADALQSQLAQQRQQTADQAAFRAQQNRQATLAQAGETASNIAAWVLPIVGVCAVVLVVGAVMLAGAKGGFVIVPVGLIVRLIMASFWND
jgi:hypothetical protein